MAIKIANVLWEALAVVLVFVLMLVVYIVFFVPFFNVLSHEVQPRTGPEIVFIVGLISTILISAAGSAFGYVVYVMAISRFLPRESVLALATWRRETPVMERILQYQTPRVHNAAMIASGLFMFLAVWIFHREVTVYLVPRPLLIEIVASPLLHAAFACGIYFVLFGRPWTRGILIAGIPVAAGVIFQLFASAPADQPYGALTYGALEAVIFVIGAAIAAALEWVVTRKTSRPAV